MLAALFSTAGLVPIVGAGLGGSPALVSIWNTAAKSNVVMNSGLGPGASLVLGVNSTNAGPINGFDINVTYDPTILKATGAMANNTAGPANCPKAQGCVFDGISTFTLRKSVDNPPGLTRLAVLDNDPVTQFVNGTGILFRISFSVVGTGATAVTITASSISNPNPVANQVINGFFDNRVNVDFDYSITPSLKLVTLTQPSFGLNTTSTSVTVVLVRGTTRNVGLSLLGLPTGANATLSPPNGTPVFTSSLTMSINGTVATGNYSLALTGSALVTGGSLTRVGWLTLRVKPVNGNHDVAILAMTVSRNFAYNGAFSNPVKVNVTAADRGTFSETFTVTAKANSTVIGTRTVTMAPGGSMVVSFNWTATSLNRGTYTLSATASTVAGEANTANNALTDGTFTVRLRGDVDNNCIVNIYDLTIVGGSFGSTHSSPNWNQYADTNNDGVISIADLSTVGGAFGLSC